MRIVAGEGKYVHWEMEYLPELDGAVFDHFSMQIDRQSSWHLALAAVSVHMPAAYHAAKAASGQPCTYDLFVFSMKLHKSVNMFFFPTVTLTAYFVYRAKWSYYVLLRSRLVFSTVLAGAYRTPHARCQYCYAYIWYPTQNRDHAR